MSDPFYFWSLILAAALATQITRFAPFLFMKYLEHNKFVQKVSKCLAPAILAVLILYCFKDNLRDGSFFTYAYILPLIILIYLQVRTRNALLSIGVAAVAYGFLLRL